MAFVPAGYYDSEEEDGFDFGGNNNDGQFDDYPVVVSQGAGPVSHEAQIGARDPDLKENGNGTGESCSVESVSHHAPVKGGKGSLFSADSFSDTSQDSNDPYHGNLSQSEENKSPVRFDVSGGQFELNRLCEDESSPKECPPLYSLRKSVNNPPPSSGPDRTRSKGQAKQLESLEDMKVALSRGNLEQVERLLDDGMFVSMYCRGPLYVDKIFVVAQINLG